MSTQIIEFKQDFVNMNWKVLLDELPSALAGGTVIAIIKGFSRK